MSDEIKNSTRGLLIFAMIGWALFIAILYNNLWVKQRQNIDNNTKEVTQLKSLTQEKIEFWKEHYLPPGAHNIKVLNTYWCSFMFGSSHYIMYGHGVSVAIARY